KLPPKSDRSYEDAPELRNISKGESLFRTRCAACHTIGGGDILDPAQQKVGPDLLYVTQKRERTWLARWLARPQEMLKAKDPIIMELLARYNNVEMPDAQLNPLEVDRLIEYMDTESRRVEKAQQLAAAKAGSSADVESSSDAGSNADARKPCCRMKEELAAADQNAEQPNRRHRVFSASMIFSSSLGCVFLLLAVVFRRRSSNPVEP
ncbi:MAG: c-type cytochrome, partial [Phycisphaerae bacterium]